MHIANKPQQEGKKLQFKRQMVRELTSDEIVLVAGAGGFTEAASCGCTAITCYDTHGACGPSVANTQS